MQTTTICYALYIYILKTNLQHNHCIQQRTDLPKVEPYNTPTLLVHEHLFDINDFMLLL